jgi:hypothetical protein
MKGTVGRSQLALLAIVAAAILAACALMLVTSTQAPAQTTAQPLLEFTFDEGSGSNAANTGTTGAALNGTIGNQVIYSTDTPLGSGSSLEFDGSGDWNSNDDMVYVPQAYTASGQPLRYYHGDKLTVEAWIKPDATNGQRIVWDDFGNPGVLLDVWDGQVDFGVSTATNPGGGAGVGGGTVEVGKWQHIAGVYDGTGLKICIDGKDTGAFTPTSGNIINLEDASPGQGGWLGTGAVVFDGKIDDFRVYAQAFRCDEVAGGYFADTTKPNITLDSPTDGATYTLGQNVIANYSCADDKSSGSDLSCTGSVPTGSSIDTGSVGTKTFTVAATDKAGNTQTKTVSYKVVSPCTIGEIAPPVNDVSSADDPGMSAYKFGSRGVIPAKFSAACNSDPIDTQAEADAHPMKLKLTKLGATPDQDAVVEDTVTGSANTGDLFRFDDAADHYIYNIGVKNLASGTYKITISDADGGATHDEWFSVK